MSQEKIHRSRSRRFGVDFEEEKAWVSFYRRVGNPAIATEVMNQLESDPEMKRTHLALYLRCKETLRTQKARLARNKRIGQFVRMLSSAMFVAPVIAIQRLLHQSGEIAVECLPNVTSEPAARRVRSLTKEHGFAQAQSEFGSRAAARLPKQASAEEANASSTAAKAV
ncbi:hypothetical protein TPL01_13550 [Sulfuriferula plumbiphila]|uniref:Uncharacterized protein n=1 Tax=Sulfuriferula plumbiphila TaxID=171865 RepID=A0A512L6Z9_9PROT|nr:hypothetical protein [Sulfuriferula plumbiphila]BBP02916.1 hypothetical protein SFPGR_03380 [Sulfuriferula plumbiphila]GEP30217.1 hypothetical protein TPL01_13550 [Sulfuriferula plumbiphila]